MLANPRVRETGDHVEIVESRSETALVTAEVHAYSWKTPAVGRYVSETAGLFDIALDRRPDSGRGRYVGESGPHRPLGEIFFVPRGTTMDARVEPCSTRSLRCQVRTGRLAAAAEIDEFVPVSSHHALRVASEEVRKSLHLLLRELITPSFGGSLMIDALATSAFVETQRYLSGVESGESGLRGTLARWQRRIIEDRLAEPIPPPDLAELAGLCRLSSRHLTRLFRKSAGEPLGAYVARVQIRRAKEMLSYGDLALKQIAHDLGFSSAGSFSRAFRAEVGLPPEFYRRQFRHAP